MIYKYIYPSLCYGYVEVFFIMSKHVLALLHLARLNDLLVYVYVGGGVCAFARTCVCVHVSECVTACVILCVPVRGRICAFIINAVNLI